MDDVNARLVKDPDSDDDTLLRAISRMTTEEAPVALWTGVANDPSYRPFQRALAIRELFRRHVSRSMTLEQIASILGGAEWLPDAAVERIDSIAGEVPVRVPADGAAFVVRLAEDPARTSLKMGFYLALDQLVEPALLRDALRARPGGKSVGGVRMVDFAFFPDSDGPARAPGAAGGQDC
jgi:hypothetical protein